MVPVNMSKVRRLSLSQAFRPSASQWNVLSRLLCALPIVLPLECALELVLEWNFPFRFNSSYASLDLLIELCHLSLLPITSEKTVFKDVQMKMYWEELIHKKLTPRDQSITRPTLRPFTSLCTNVSTCTNIQPSSHICNIH